MIGIYKITNPQGKVYIGQSVNINKRKNCYAQYRCKDQISIYRSLIKYGFENHKFEVIEECKLEELIQREIFWKKYYLNQVSNRWDQVLFCKLNDGKGGNLREETKFKISQSNKGKKRDKIFCENIKNRNLGNKHSEETKLKMRKPKSIPSPLKNKKQSQEHIENRISKIRNKKRNPKSYLGINTKKIIQYDLKNQFIKIWDSIKSAEIIYGKGIKSVLSGRTYTAGGFIWRYENTILPPDYKIPPHPNLKPTIQYDLNGNFIKEWESLIQIEKELGYKNSNISSNINGKTKMAYGYKWKYKE